MTGKINKISIIVSLTLIITACTSSVRFTSKTEKSANDYENLRVQTGIASFYSDEFHNKITYSGEVYNMNSISAAHPFFPMGTLVRVTNLSNNKSVVLKINDRMPYRPDRIIDLSLGAARELGFVEDGLAEVKVEVLEWGKGKK
ncbi:septal ring lytic transglycosylase RlpA family protein [Melioribacter sp. Ez-97]|uniref:septal ring lytic transglycosylase RlpA family protein n=1 Tax=Melioribacter sp. Ez-97 TaxID=3423434 RepID=UPI003EDA8995